MAQVFSDHYATLKIAQGPSATQIEIKDAYRKLALSLHPDKNAKIDTTKQFQALGTAYELLKDEEKKQDYDITWNAKKRQPKPQSKYDTFTAQDYDRYNFDPGFGAQPEPQPFYQSYGPNGYHGNPKQYQNQSFTGSSGFGGASQYQHQYSKTSWSHAQQGQQYQPKYPSWSQFHASGYGGAQQSYHQERDSYDQKREQEAWEKQEKQEKERLEDVRKVWEQEQREWAVFEAARKKLEELEEKSRMRKQERLRRQQERKQKAHEREQKAPEERVRAAMAFERERAEALERARKTKEAPPTMSKCEDCEYCWGVDPKECGAFHRQGKRFCEACKAWVDQERAGKEQNGSKSCPLLISGNEKTPPQSRKRQRITIEDDEKSTQSRKRQRITISDDETTTKIKAEAPKAGKRSRTIVLSDDDEEPAAKRLKSSKPTVKSPRPIVISDDDDESAIG